MHDEWSNSQGDNFVDTQKNTPKKKVYTLILPQITMKADGRIGLLPP